MARRSAFRIDIASGDVAQTLQTLLDLLLGAGVLELRELLLESVGDELLDRGVARDVGVLLHPCQQVFIELDSSGAEHVQSSFSRGWIGSSIPNSRSTDCARSWSRGAGFLRGRFVRRIPGT